MELSGNTIYKNMNIHLSYDFILLYWAVYFTQNDSGFPNHADKFVFLRRIFSSLHVSGERK